MRLLQIPCQLHFHLDFLDFGTVRWQIQQTGQDINGFRLPASGEEPPASRQHWVILERGKVAYRGVSGKNVSSPIVTTRKTH